MSYDTILIQLVAMLKKFQKWNPFGGVGCCFNTLNKYSLLISEEQNQVNKPSEKLLCFL